MNEALQPTLSPSLCVAGMRETSTPATTGHMGNSTQPRVAMDVLLTSGARLRVVSNSASALDATLSCLAKVTSKAFFGVATGLDGEPASPSPSAIVLLEPDTSAAALTMARSPHQATPLMVVSSNLSQEPALLDAGADAFCPFPIDARLFEARLRVLLRRGQPPMGPARRTVLLGLDESGVLNAGDVSIRLSPREQELIVLLYQRRDCWVPRRTLVQALTIGSVAADSSLLRTHVLNIRNKLGNWRWMLRSERSAGLMLTANEAHAESVDIQDARHV